MTVGEPKRITAIINRSISSNSEKRQHTNTRARTSVSREQADVAAFNQKAFLFNVNLVWLSLSNNNENRRHSQFGADIENTRAGWG